MTVIVGTAGHIDHGKTTLLRAITGIDADRLPEEQRRGMTLDVGYAHLVLPNGRLLDFVDVPGHDRLIGNMLVGAGEVDAAMLVVAADDGPRAQTLEHLALLDAYGIADGLVVIAKADLVPAERVAEVRGAVAGLLAKTALAGVPVVAASAATGDGLDALVDELTRLEERLASATARPATAPRLAIDRVFTIRGRGTVVTGSQRGRGFAAGDTVRIEPGGRTARVREVQVHGAAVRGSAPPGRAALNLSGIEADDLRRGQVVTTGPGLEITDRLLVELRRPAALGPGDRAPWLPRDGARVRLHVGTDQVGARVGSSGREAVALDADRSTALLRLDAPVAVAIGDRFVLRRPSPGDVEGGGTVLDPLPPTGPARRRITLPRIAALRHAVVEQGAATSVVDALADLHGALAAERVAAAAAISRAPAEASAGATEPRLAADLEAELTADAVSLVVRSPADADGEAGVPAAEIRRRLASRLARTTGLPERSATTLVDRLVSGLVSGGLLARDGERLRDPSVAAGPPPELLAAMDRLERLLNAPAPPPLARAAEDAACPAAGIRALESGGRIVRVEADLAWSAPAYHRLAAQALAMARAAPLSPAAFRDATGTSRRYVLAILEDLDRRGILQRGPDGHRPGPRAPRASPAGAGTRET